MSLSDLSFMSHDLLLKHCALSHSLSYTHKNTHSKATFMYSQILTVSDCIYAQTHKITNQVTDKRMCTDNTFVKKKNTSIQSCMNICIMQTIQTQNALSTMEKDYNKLDFFFHLYNENCIP